MPALSGVLPAWYLLLPVHGERPLGSAHVVHTTHWPFDGDLQLAQVAGAANAGATSLRTNGDSDTTSAHRPGEAERGWHLPVAQALPAPQARLSPPHRATRRDAPK